MAVFRAANRRVARLDAAPRHLRGRRAGRGAGPLRWLLIDRFHPQALLSADAPTAFATLSPAASGIASACQETLFWLALLVLIAYWCGASNAGPAQPILAGIVAVAGLVPGAIHTGGEFLLYYGSG